MYIVGKLFLVSSISNYRNTAQKRFNGSTHLVDLKSLQHSIQTIFMLTGSTKQQEHLGLHHFTGTGKDWRQEDITEVTFAISS